MRALFLFLFSVLVFLEAECLGLRAAVFSVSCVLLGWTALTRSILARVRASRMPFHVRNCWSISPWAHHARVRITRAFSVSLVQAQGGGR